MTAQMSEYVFFSVSPGESESTIISSGLLEKTMILVVMYKYNQIKGTSFFSGQLDLQGFLYQKSMEAS